MQISEIIDLLLALLAGMTLGLVFFGGLWLTVRKGLQFKNSAVFIFMASLLVRTAIVVLGFYYVAAGSWQKMLLCLAGFLIARVVIVRQQNKQQPIETTVVKPESNEN